MDNVDASVSTNVADVSQHVPKYRTRLFPIPGATRGMLLRLRACPVSFTECDVHEAEVVDLLLLLRSATDLAEPAMKQITVAEGLRQLRDLVWKGCPPRTRYASWCLLLSFVPAVAAEVNSVLGEVRRTSTCEGADTTLSNSEDFCDSTLFNTLNHFESAHRLRRVNEYRSLVRASYDSVPWDYLLAVQGFELPSFESRVRVLRRSWKCVATKGSEGSDIASLSLAAVVVITYDFTGSALFRDARDKSTTRKLCPFGALSAISLPTAPMESLKSVLLTSIRKYREIIRCHTKSNGFDIDDTLRSTNSLLQRPAKGGALGIPISIDERNALLARASDEEIKILRQVRKDVPRTFELGSPQIATEEIEQRGSFVCSSSSAHSDIEMREEDTPLSYSKNGAANSDCDTPGSSPSRRAPTPRAAILQHPLIKDLMERILYLWSLRHPASGYVQGMNDLLLPYLITVFAEALYFSGSNGGCSQSANLGSERGEEGCYYDARNLPRGFGSDPLTDHLTVPGTAVEIPRRSPCCEMPSVASTLSNGDAHVTALLDCVDIAALTDLMVARGLLLECEIVHIADADRVAIKTQQDEVPTADDEAARDIHITKIISPSPLWVALESDVFHLFSAGMDTVQDQYTPLAMQHSDKPFAPKTGLTSGAFEGGATSPSLGTAGSSPLSPITTTKGTMYSLINKFDRVVRNADPHLHEFITGFAGISFELFAFRWMTCFLLRELPPLTCLRLFDTFTSEIATNTAGNNAQGGGGTGNISSSLLLETGLSASLDVGSKLSASTANFYVYASAALLIDVYGPKLATIYAQSLNSGSFEFYREDFEKEFEQWSASLQKLVVMEVEDMVDVSERAIGESTNSFRVAAPTMDPSSGADTSQDGPRQQSSLRGFRNSFRIKPPSPTAPPIFIPTLKSKGTFRTTPQLSTINPLLFSSSMPSDHPSVCLSNLIDQDSLTAAIMTALQEPAPFGWELGRGVLDEHVSFVEERVRRMAAAEEESAKEREKYELGSSSLVNNGSPPACNLTVEETTNTSAHKVRGGGGAVSSTLDSTAAEEELELIGMEGESRSVSPLEENSEQLLASFNTSSFCRGDWENPTPQGELSNNNNNSNVIRELSSPGEHRRRQWFPTPLELEQQFLEQLRQQNLTAAPSSPPLRRSSVGVKTTSRTVDEWLSKAFLLKMLFDKSLDQLSSTEAATSKPSPKSATLSSSSTKAPSSFLEKMRAKFSDPNQATEALSKTSALTAIKVAQSSTLTATFEVSLGKCLEITPPSHPSTQIARHSSVTKRLRQLSAHGAGGASGVSSSREGSMRILRDGESPFTSVEPSSAPIHKPFSLGGLLSNSTPSSNASSVVGTPRLGGGLGDGQQSANAPSPKSLWGRRLFGRNGGPGKSSTPQQKQQ